jgi:hypothetical protein
MRFPSLASGSVIRYNQDSLGESCNVFDTLLLFQKSYAQHHIVSCDIADGHVSFPSFRPELLYEKWHQILL